MAGVGTENWIAIVGQHVSSRWLMWMVGVVVVGSPPYCTRGVRTLLLTEDPKCANLTSLGHIATMLFTLCLNLAIWAKVNEDLHLRRQWL